MCVASLPLGNARAAGVANLLEQSVDGDTGSWNAIIGDESLQEVRHFLNTKAAYVDPRGGLHASSNVATVALVLQNMTG